MDGSMRGAYPPEDCIKSRGILFPKDGKVMRGRIRGMLRDGHYEAKETEAVLKIVTPEDTVLELGAGIGYMSALVARNRNVRAVHAFEANPDLVPYIESVYRANGLDNATVTHAILGPRKGQADFHVRKNLLTSSMEEIAGTKVLSVETVPVLSADTVMKQVQPTVLICDIEGAEARLIPAMDLSGLRAVIIELHPQFIRQDGVQAVFEAMSTAGLTYFPKLSQGKVVTFRKGW